MKGFDKWLTTPPFEMEDAFEEDVINSFSDEFFDKYQNLLDKNLHSIFWQYIDRLMYTEHTAKESAAIIERLFKLYKIQP
jgi:hypothetical protein